MFKRLNPLSLSQIVRRSRRCWKNVKQRLLASVKWCSLLALVASQPALGRGQTRPKLFTVDPTTAIFITGAIDSSLEAIVMPRIAAVAAMKPRAVTIVVDSTGGSVDSGIKMMSALANLAAGGAAIKCIVTGEAASMALYMLIVCDQRYALQYTTIMWHSVRRGAPSPISATTARKIAIDLAAREELLDKQLCAAMKLEPKFYYDHKYAESDHFAVNIAKAGGFFTIVDGIDGVPASQLFAPATLSSMIDSGADSSGMYWGR